ncbi:MAG: PD-(D/E)XK motif protein [Bacteroidota bacterium]|nr:PD-(D/E)XK motif protein [Bacteroidota bacterium]
MTTPWDNIQRPSEAYNVRLTEWQGIITTYWGKDTNGKCLFLAKLEGDHVQTLREAALSIHGIDIDLRGRPQSSHQNLVLTLISHLDRELFHALCKTMARRMCRAVDPAHALEIAIGHLKRWQKFLSGGRTQLLSAEEIRGLYAELDLFHALLRLGVGSVDCWQGPEGADQDFLVGDVAIEVKSLPSQATSKVHIASDAQLDSAAGSLFLAVKNVGSGPDGQSLNDRVRELCAMLPGTAAVQTFQDRLSRVGYEELDHYDAPQLQVSATRIFEVREGFPRLIRSKLPAGVVSVRYSLDIGALKPFECPIIQFWNRLDENGHHT